MRPTIAITVGDPNGIGPEIILKALVRREMRSRARFAIIAPKSVFDPALAETVKFELAVVRQTSCLDGLKDDIVFIDPGLPEEFRVTPGRETKAGGQVAGRSLERALEFAVAGKVEAIVTAPLAKHLLNLAGYNYPGQTEFLADYLKVEDVVMTMISDRFRVALATTHCALSQVASLVTVRRIGKTLQVLDNDLRSRFSVREPRIAVCALNPHAGEKGMFGLEERTVISPAITEARRRGILAEGPFPADTLFSEPLGKKYDAYVAMYHDQGLIAAKMQSFERAVNYTAGLPVVRTSPDHGTAFGIAGKGVAISTSMEEAIKLASALAAEKPAG
ncbi:MAG: 4-hydroxythreonine-4-phosphate dehydrogenase PdxA [bacterium]